MRRTALLPLLLFVLAARAQAPDVVGWWTFDGEGAAVTDAGPASLHGELKATGELPRREPGLRGQALHFDAAAEGYVQLPKDAAFDLAPPFTIAAWIKPTQASRAMEIVCGKDDVRPQGYRLRFFWRRLGFELGDGTERHLYSTEPYSLPVDYWTHVAAVHDGERVRLYLNAEEALSAEAPAPAPEGRAPVIGNYIGRKNAYAFDGWIDDVVIVRRALDGEALYRLAANGEL